MKIYCKLCDKVQPVIIDNCRDAKTNAPFQDIVCKECHLVIAAGTDIQREWVDLTDDEIDVEANKILTSDPVQWWRRLARAVLAKSKEKNT